MRHILLSDAHLLPDRKPHPGRDGLTGFIKSLENQDPGSLWVLGDLFEYWFEYRTVAPGGFGRVLSRFRALFESGWSLHFIPGNHDWWVGDFFRGETGFQIHRETPLRVDFHGKTAVLAHGDGLGRGDWSYRMVKPVLRSAVSSRLFSLLHPTPATALAMLFGSTSRKYMRRKVRTIPEHLDAWAEKQLDDAELVVTGHTHVPRMVPRRGGFHVSLGDWINSCTYLKVEEGMPSLERYEG